MSKRTDSGRRPPSGPTPSDELRTALKEGNPDRVRALIEAGADPHYRREHGYDALLDAVHGHDVARNPQLLELLALLAAHAVDLSGISAYGESGLRVLSHIGRFDAVRLLLDAGADASQLGWTPLMEAVALGSRADVQGLLAEGAALEERDWWSRTAWLIALLTGDIAKAKLLREHGANTEARGRCGRPPLFHAIQAHHAHVVRWLLREGADVHQTDEFGTTALIEAAEYDDLECVDVLLDAGADVETNVHGTALSRASSRAVVMHLLDAGADPADADQRIVLGLGPVRDDALVKVSPTEFHRGFKRTFGRGNPERMNVAFWNAMVQGGTSAYEARRRFGVECAFDGEPVWCAQRNGQSFTLLPDHRAVQIGGEHEDFYDPDFCIYNDVFVHELDGSVTIHGYPESVFPPTDFHTATLLGDSIYVVGCLGYRGSRRYGETPVFRLNVRTLQMDRLDTQGEAPGWIHGHRAVAMGTNGIRVQAGKVTTANRGVESLDPNLDCFVLDLDRLLWHRESKPGSVSR